MKGTIKEDKFDSFEEMRSAIKEWLKVDSFSGEYNDYSKYNKIYFFDFLENEKSPFAIIDMPVDIKQREVYLRPIKKLLKRDNVESPLPFERIRNVTIEFIGESGSLEFTPKEMKDINDTIKAIIKPEFVTPYIAVLHHDTTDNPHLHFLYMTHNKETNIAEYLGYLDDKEAEV